MRLAVEILGAMASLPKLRLCQTAQSILTHRLVHDLAANQASGQLQNVLNSFGKGWFYHGLAPQKFCFQSVNGTSKSNSGVCFQYQNIPVQMGHMLRLLGQNGPVFQLVFTDGGLGCRENFNPLPVQKIPGSGG